MDGSDGNKNTVDVIIYERNPRGHLLTFESPSYIHSVPYTVTSVAVISPAKTALVEMAVGMGGGGV